MVQPWVYGGIGGATLGLIFGDSWLEVGAGFVAGTPAGQRGFTWLGERIVTHSVHAAKTPWVQRLAWKGASRVFFPLWLASEMVDLTGDFAAGLQGDHERLHSNDWVATSDWVWNNNPTSQYSGFNRFLDLFDVENPLATAPRF